MLPAQKDKTASAHSAEGNPGGFGRVLNSIQGLQQRLDDFSIEDVSHAQAKVSNLIRGLSLLQLKLDDLAIKQRAIAAARHTIGEIPADHFDQFGLNSLENYPTLSVMLKASELIDLVRPRAQLLAVFFDQWITTHETVEVTIVKSDPESIKALPSPLLQLEASPANETSAERLQSVASVESKASAGKVALPSVIETAGAEQQAGTDSLVPRQKIAEAQAQTHVVEAISQSDENASSVGLDETRGRQAPSAVQPDYNQHLLDDLINAYGDFASLPNLSAPRNAAQPTPKKTSEHKTNTVHVALKSTSVATTQGNAPPVEVPTIKAMTQAVMIPPLETRQSQPVEDSAAPLTKHGEIDRQLKNIIKDYGEYDLYQRHSSPNLKTAGVVATALLGLILAGFYFFTSSPPIASRAIDSPVQADGKSSTDSKTSKGVGVNSLSTGRAATLEAGGDTTAGERPLGGVTRTEQQNRESGIPR